MKGITKDFKPAFYLLQILTFCCVLLAGCSKNTSEPAIVSVKSIPGGAQVYIDGELVTETTSGKDGSSLMKLPAGTYIVSATKPVSNYQEFFTEQVLSVENSAAVEIILELEKRPSEYLKKSALQVNMSPDMVHINGASYLMGCNVDSNCGQNETPPTMITISSFKISKNEVTFELWDACYAAGVCKHLPDDYGWGRQKRPVVDVSYNEITTEFLPWLNNQTNRRYRLPSKAEWEYAARGGNRFNYLWDDYIKKNKANCDGCGSQWDNKQTAPVGTFPPNSFGIHDMYGNVSEFVDYSLNNVDKQNDGAATSSVRITSLNMGRSWNDSSDKAINYAFINNRRFDHLIRKDSVGFRLAYD